MKDFFSKYSREARVYPTIIGLIPFFILQYYYLSDFLPDAIFTFKVIGNVTVSIVVLYLVSEFFVRFPSKLFEDKIFEKKRKFPTTELLLFSNSEYTEGFKIQAHIKIKKDFNLTLSDQVEEGRDGNVARQKIKEAVGLIIKRIDSGHLVLQHNISYGFFRNLWGASIIGLILSLCLIGFAYHNNQLVTGIGLILLFVYLLYLFFGKYVIVYFGENYAKKLIEEYVSEKNEN